MSQPEHFGEVLVQLEDYYSCSVELMSSPVDHTFVTCMKTPKTQITSNSVTNIYRFFTSLHSPLHHAHIKEGSHNPPECHRH